MNHNPRKSIRAIKKEYGVGFEKAQYIQSVLYNKEFNGRKPISISQEEVDYVLNYKDNFNVGYQRIAKVAQLDENAPQGIGEWKVRKIFDYHDLYNYQEDYIPKESHDKRFVARYAGQAWHTDLHYLELLAEENYKQKYLIGFVDDRSRKLLYYEILEDKEAESTTNALLNALKIYSKPKTLIIDNGKEFIAKCFVSALNLYGINKHNVHPYTPEENGQVERFWYTIERAKVRPLRGSYLESLIEQYNKFWVHGGLKEITQRNLTPNQAWDSMPHYIGQDDANYIYY